jgi:UDP-N-acetylglucosamine 2-epimerase
LKIVSIVGARPEFIQAAPLSRALRQEHQEILVHTGQHYDAPLSQALFDDLELPAPNYNLAVGPGSHTHQTAKIMLRLEEVLREERPDLVMVRGDTNSTLASALTASKLDLPLAHVEAGERSFNRQMPEEVNRKVVDALADLHFCASHTALDQLALEGIRESAHWVGDVLLDAMTHYRPIAHRRSNVLERLRLRPGGYCLVTIHRPGATDDAGRLRQLVQALNQVEERVVFPVHPRTAKALAGAEVRLASHVQAIEPVGFLDMILLEEHARLIATDSGGVQREAYFLGVPCLTLRDETEWVETVQAGWNEVVGTDPERVLAAWRHFRPAEARPPIFGDGAASQRIADILSRADALPGRAQEAVLIEEQSIP